MLIQYIQTGSGNTPVNFQGWPVAQTCCISQCAKYRKSVKFGYPWQQNPRRDRHENYVRDPTLTSKFRSEWAAQVVSLHVWNITDFPFSFFFVLRFFTSPTGHHGWPIFTIYTSMTELHVFNFSHKEVPFRGLDDEFSHFAIFLPQNLKICITAYGDFKRQ